MKIRRIVYKMGKKEIAGYYVESKQGLRQIKLIGDPIEIPKENITEDSEVYFDKVSGEFK